MRNREALITSLAQDLKYAIPGQHMTEVLSRILDLPRDRRVKLTRDYLRLGTNLVASIASLPDNSEFTNEYCQTEARIDRTNPDIPVCIYDCGECDYHQEFPSNFSSFTDNELVAELHAFDFTKKPFPASSYPEWGLELCGGNFKSCYNIAFAPCPGGKKFPADTMTRFF